MRSFRYFSIGLLLVLGALGSMTATSQAQVTVDALLKNAIETVGPEHRDVATAIEEFKKGNLLEARRLLEAAKKSDPKIPPPGLMLAQLLYAANQQAMARNELEGVVKTDTNDPEAYLMFGELALQERRFSDAELDFRRAEQLITKYDVNPFRRNMMLRRIYSGLARVAEVRENWAEAQKFLDPIVKADPKDAGSVTRMAASIFRQGKEKEAYKLLQDLWTADNTVTRPEITMGILYEEKGDRTQASSLMKKAAERDPKGLASQLAVSRWALEAGDMDLATKCSAMATQVSPDSIEAKLVSGLVARYKNDFAAARKTLEEAHLASPSNLAAMLQLAVVLIETPGKEAAGLEYAQMAQRVYADTTQATGREAGVTLAWVLYKQGKVGEAQQILQQVLAGGAVSSESSYFSARILSQGGNNKEISIKLLQNALKNDRVFPGRADAEKMLISLGGTIPAKESATAGGSGDTTPNP